MSSPAQNIREAVKLWQSGEALNGLSEADFGRHFTEYVDEFDRFESLDPAQRQTIVKAWCVDDPRLKEALGGVDQKNEPGKATHFWKTDSDGNAKILRSGLVRSWAEAGYRKSYIEDSLSSRLVRVENQQVRYTSAERVKDFTMKSAREQGSSAVEAALMKGANVYFAENMMQFVPELEADFKRDTPEEAFFYFPNAYVRVTAGGVEVKKYRSLEGYIWSDQKRPHDFEKLSSEQARESDFAQFTRNISGEDERRHEALRCAIGYMLHAYKDPSRAKALALVDERVSDVPEGRGGKSLLASSLRHVVPGHRVDARNFSFDRSFAFQAVRPGQRVFDFNDASKSFDFERLFSAITDDITVERKGQDPFTIPFSESPKFVITTNYVLKGQGGSFEDRVIQWECAPYYDKSHRPLDDFGKRFFDGWDAAEWNHFYNFMLRCTQEYLSNGLVEYEHINLKLRRLQEETSTDFADWILEKQPKKYNKAALFESFKADYPGDYDDWLTQRLFTRWCNTFGRMYTGDKLKSSKSGSKRYIHLPEVEA